MRRPTESPKTPANRAKIPLTILLAPALLLAPSGILAQAHRAEASEAAVKQLTQPERRIVISIPDRKLALLENGHVVKIYRVAVGAPASPSPSGEFTIVHRLTDPAYYAPGVVIPPGPENPLGPRWIGLSVKGFGIHGTNEPRSVGHHVSHGCIRMRNRDAKELFERVRLGDRVEIIGQRNEEIASIFGGRPTVPAAAPQAIQTAQTSEPGSSAEGSASAQRR
jgi:lipoprotein-anchoring transpeptidase ErfK/SrfK